MSNKLYDLIDMLATPDSILKITELIVKRETGESLPKGRIFDEVKCPLAKAFHVRVETGTDIKLKHSYNGPSGKKIEQYMLTKFIEYFDAKQYPQLIRKR